jgi:hypothetical protein
VWAVFDQGGGCVAQGITLAEFKEVYRLRPRLHDMTVALNTYGGAMGSISKADFERASRLICGVKLTPVQVRQPPLCGRGCERTCWEQTEPAASLCSWRKPTESWMGRQREKL